MKVSEEFGSVWPRLKCANKDRCPEFPPTHFHTYSLCPRTRCKYFTLVGARRVLKVLDPTEARGCGCACAASIKHTSSAVPIIVSAIPVPTVAITVVVPEISEHAQRTRLKFHMAFRTERERERLR